VALSDAVLDLPVTIEGYALERLEHTVSSGFTRVSTIVAVHGGGLTGHGEDVSYMPEDQETFPTDLPLAGSRRLGDLSEAVGAMALFPGPPAQEAAADYRRWAVESAVLDLALRQAGRPLGDVVGRPYRPVTFVVSTRGSVEDWIAAQPSIAFKLDVEAEWDRPLMERLAATGRVRCVDLKAYYHGTVVDLAPDPELYRAVAESFPDAVIEDPAMGDEQRAALAGALDRVSFDAPIHSLADVDALPVAPRWLNIKPSRFGSVARLLDCIEACEARGIAMYGGGQFELGVGRRQVQALASLFYADAPNDVAPGDYNVGDPRPGLPASPLPAPDGGPGIAGQ
jgi:L-alanine-DL-glutamate epimerase-like enolase superfamily enzyme